MKPTNNTQQVVDEYLLKVKEGYREVKEVNQKQNLNIKGLNKARLDNGEAKLPTADKEDMAKVFVALAEDTTIPNIDHWEAISLANLKPNEWANQVLHNLSYSTSYSYDKALLLSANLKDAEDNESMVKKEVIGSKNKRTVNSVMNSCKKAVNRSSTLKSAIARIDKLEQAHKEVLDRLDYHEKVIPSLRQGQTMKELAIEMLNSGMTEYKVAKELKGGVSKSTIHRLNVKLKKGSEPKK